MWGMLLQELTDSAVALFLICLAMGWAARRAWRSTWKQNADMVVIIDREKDSCGRWHRFGLLLGKFLHRWHYLKSSVRGHLDVVERAVLKCGIKNRTRSPSNG